MSGNVERNQVFQTTRVRTSLKNDVSWIQRSKQEKEEQDKARRDEAVESRPALARQNSYVLSTAKKFESVDTPRSPPHQKTQFVPSEGDSANQANGDVISSQNDAQPEGSTVETTDDTKPQAPTEQPIQNGEAPPLETLANIAAEIKEAYADVAADKSNTEHDEAKVSTDAHVEDPATETSAEAVTEQGTETTEVPAALTVEPKPQEKLSTETEPTNATNVEDAGVESTVQPAEETCPPEQAVEEIVKSVAEVVVESSPDKSEVINATPGEEAALQDSVEPVPELLAESASESPTQAAAETALKSVECEVESAASAEPVIKTEAEEVVECDIQPGDNTVLEQSVDPAPESAADRVVELNLEDAVEPVTASDAEAQDDLSYRAIELSEALDEEPPTAEAAPEPLVDPEQSHTDEPEVTHQSDDTNTSETLQKPVEEVESTQIVNGTSDDTPLCTVCDTIIDGNVKIRFSEPLVICHPDCLKCGVCAKALGDLLTPMFLHNQVIQCDGCVAKALKT